MAIRGLHIGDLHFWRFPTNPAHLLGKRILGVGNLAVRRSRAFRTARASLLAERMADLRPDWVLFSGDFTTTSLEAEYSAAKRAMARAGGLEDGRILAVPGNHDRYTRQAILQRPFEAHFGSWCSGGQWPWIRELGEGVWAAGIDATTSNGVNSFGRLPADQLSALRQWWMERGQAVREFWLVCHFPAEDPPGVLKPSRLNELRGSNALVDFLGSLCVPVVYLHGHHHRRWLFGSPKAENVIYLDAGAPLLRRGGPEPDLGFFALEHENGGTAITLHTRDAVSGGWQSAPVRRPKPGEFLDLQVPAAGLPEDLRPAATP